MTNKEKTKGQIPKELSFVRIIIRIAVTLGIIIAAIFMAIIIIGILAYFGVFSPK